MSEEKWIVYRDRCQSLEKKLSLLESERDRLGKALEEIKGLPFSHSRRVGDYESIARTALESSQPEGKKAVITKIGYIGEDGNPTGFEFDCRGGIPGFQIVEGDKILYGGWTVEELKEMVQPEGRTVTVEEIAKVLFGLAPATIETITLNDCRIIVDRLLDHFDVRRK